MKFTTIVGICIALLLTGCAPRDPMLNGQVHEYILEDGTRCAVLIGHRKGGIDCDWK